MQRSAIFLLITAWSLFWHASLAAVIGVDYGQQFIKAMVVSPKAPMELLLTPEAKRKDVSGLAIKTFGDNNEEIERFYGSAVGSIATRFPKNSLLHIKPLLGKTTRDEKDILLYLRGHPGVDIVPTERNSLAFLVGDVQYPVEELTAMNLQEIVNRANALLSEKDPNNVDMVDKVALTVPEFFNQYQREALLDSASITTDGLDTYLVNDGLSVMINFALKKRDFTGKSYYVVYDMGAGSTRASLFSVEQPENKSQPIRIEFGGYGYNAHLGGSKFTLDVASLIENKFSSKHKNIRTDELHRNMKALAKIIQAAEKAKLILSANTEASVNIESLINDIDLRTKITKQEFEDFNEDLSNIVQPITDAFKNQLWNDQVDINQLSGVILTGGSTRVPIVQHKITDFVGESKILKNVNADESAVDGTTVRGIKLFGAFRTKPINITERSISEYAMRRNDLKEVIFPRGNIFPAQKTVTIGYADEFSGEISLDLWEDSFLFQSVKADTAVTDKIYSPEKCPQGIIYNATFSLSQNRLFGLDRIDAICLKDPSTSNGKSLNETELEKKIGFGNSRRSVKLMESKENTIIRDMSLEERLKYREYIRALDLKDAARFELEEAKNLLEGLLYETRVFLELEEVAEKGPKKLLTKLAHAVTNHLSWLEDESDVATKQEVVLKSLEVQELKDRVEAYLQALSEPLDSQQFESILGGANELLARFTGVQNNHHGYLDLLEKNFTDLGYDVHKEYSNINLPDHIATSLENWNDTLLVFKDALDLVDYATSGDVESMDREQLFEIKTAFDMASAELQSITHYFDLASEYRLRELLSRLQKTEKAKKRKEERSRKRAAEKQKRIESESFTSEKTPLESSMSFTAEPSISIQKEEVTSSTLIHDEL